MELYGYITVIRVPIGKSELRRLGDDVDEVALRQTGHVETGQERELLEGDRSLSPGAGLAHRYITVRKGHGRLERRLPFGQVRAGQEPALRAREAVDLLGHEPVVVDAPRALDLLLARPAARLLEQAPPGRSERWIPERRPGSRRRQVERRRRGPLAQERLDPLDRRGDPRDDRVPTVGVS